MTSVTRTEIFEIDLFTVYLLIMLTTKRKNTPTTCLKCNYLQLKNTTVPLKLQKKGQQIYLAKHRGKREINIR